MSRLIARGSRFGVLSLIALVLLAACSNSTGSSGGAAATGGASDVGVTPHEIMIGGLASATGPLANQYSPIWDAVQAYLDQVNAHGGVYGRKIVYSAKLDDGFNPSNDVTQARALVEQDNVFAVVGVASPEFSGGKYLAQQNIPTFGWNINPEFASGPSLFGLPGGSYLDFTDPGPTLPWLAKHLGTIRVAALAYGVVQSFQCADGDEYVFTRQFKGFDFVLKDTSIPFGVQDLSADIQKIKNSNANLIVTCMDPGGNKIISQNLQEAGIYDQVKQYWPNGYDEDSLKAYAPYMQNVYFDTNGVVPYVYGYTKGMDDYLDAMRRHHITIGAVTLAGWMSADLFVRALRAVGPNPTRAKVIKYVNSLTHYTANNISPGINWTTAHNKSNGVTCTSFVQVQRNTFVPVFGTKTNPFICWHGTYTNSLDPVPFPNGPSFFDSTRPMSYPFTAG
jgi:branched-chain amino acid transport system substrate-binding protein